MAVQCFVYTHNRSQSLLYVPSAMAVQSFLTRTIDHSHYCTYPLERWQYNVSCTRTIDHSHYCTYPPRAMAVQCFVSRTIDHSHYCTYPPRAMAVQCFLYTHNRSQSLL
ncbi:hypothetical protein J6590_092222, partial [Homalodisca vitripennis]